MGQKVSPIGLRVGIIRDWDSRWYANKNEFATLLHEDIKIREFLTSKLGRSAAVSRIEIERSKNRVEVYVHTAKPGLVIGREGKDIEVLRNGIIKITNKEVNLSIVEIKNADLDAKLVADKIAEQIEGRASFRTAQKRAIRQSMKSGAKGVKTLVSGRLGGADMARGEGYSEGVVPLHTLRADIDYAVSEADTTFGKIGVKVWICKGEILPQKGNKKEGK